MPISEWNELVQGRNEKLTIHMPMSQLRGKLLFLLMRKGGRVKSISAGSLPSTNPNISVTVMWETHFSPKYNVATRQEEFSMNDNACIPMPVKTSHHHPFERANMSEKKDQEILIKCDPKHQENTVLKASFTMSGNFSHCTCSWSCELWLHIICVWCFWKH